MEQQITRFAENETGVELIIVLDCGIKAVEEIISRRSS